MRHAHGEVGGGDRLGSRRARASPTSAGRRPSRPSPSACPNTRWRFNATRGHGARDRPAASRMSSSWTPGPGSSPGPNSDGAHNPVTSRRIERGDIMVLNCFPMMAGYYAALERTLFAETCSDEHLRLWRINVEVHEAGLALIRPGARCRDIAAELNAIYEGYGLLEEPHLRLRPQLRRTLPLLRPRGRAGAARGRGDRSGARHGAFNGADDHDPRRPAPAPAATANTTSWW